LRFDAPSGVRLANILAAGCVHNRNNSFARQVIIADPNAVGRGVAMSVRVILSNQEKAIRRRLVSKAICV
jgi:hypothetical protein